MAIENKGVSKVWADAAKRSGRIGSTTTDPRRKKRKVNIMIAAERKDVRDGFTLQAHSLVADFLKLKRKFSTAKGILRNRRRGQRLTGGK